MHFECTDTEPRVEGRERVMSAAGPSSSSMSSAAASSQRRRWHFTKEEMMHTASQKEGYDYRWELGMRQQAARFIQTMGDRLNHGIRESRSKISQLCMCSAMVNMHRFYYFHSFKAFDFRDLAAACLFLAGKAEECPRKLEHIVRVWWQLKFPKFPNIPQRNYVDAAQLIVTLENVVLQTIAFDLKIDLPHAVVLKEMQPIARGNKKLTEVAYFFATDVLCVTDWAIRYTAAEIAAVCIYAVCAWADHQIPEDGPIPWYRSFTSLTEERLKEIATFEFMSVYESCKDQLKLTKFVQKGYIHAPRAAERKPMIDGSGDSGSLLPPPPAPPSIQKNIQRVDFNEYKSRSSLPASSAPVVPHPERRSFIPDMSATNLATVAVSASGLDTKDVKPLINGNGDEHSSVPEYHHKEHKEKKHKEHKEKKHKKDKEHKREREEREKHHHREKEVKEEDRKRSHDRVLSSGVGSSSNLFPAEKRPRTEISAVDRNRASQGGWPAQVPKMSSIPNGSCRQDLSSSLPPPPPPPSQDALEDGEVL